MIGRFRSRFALWSIRVGIVVPGALALGLAGFELGGCVIGMTQFGGCTRLPDALGEWLLIAGLVGMYLSVFLMPPLVIGGLIGEWLARRRERRG